MTTRPQLRQFIRQKRRALSTEQKQQSALQLAERLAGYRPFQKSQHIACYLPNDGEISLEPLIEYAWSEGKQVYLPVLAEPGSQRLWFISYQPDSLLRNNRFGIPEPVHAHHQRLFKTLSLDMILMPLVAFDQQGNRLGMGGGYYDRTLAFLRSRQYWHKPRLVGVAYDFQRQQTLEHQPWDVPLHAIATDQQLYHVK